MTHSSGCSAVAGITRFEVQSLLFNELRALNVRVRGGYRVETGRGWKRVDVAVLSAENRVVRVFFVSAGVECTSVESKQQHDDRCFKSAKRFSTVGIPVTMVYSLKDASDFVLSVKQCGQLPSPTIRGTLKTVNKERSPADPGQILKLKELCHVLKREISDVYLSGLSAGKARKLIRSMQGICRKKNLQIARAE